MVHWFCSGKIVLADHLVMWFGLRFTFFFFVETVSQKLIKLFIKKIQKIPNNNYTPTTQQVFIFAMIIFVSNTITFDYFLRTQRFVVYDLYGLQVQRSRSYQIYIRLLHSKNGRGAIVISNVIFGAMPQVNVFGFGDVQPSTLRTRFISYDQGRPYRVCGVKFSSEQRNCMH